MRILYIHHNGIPPVSDPARDRFHGMDLECDMLRPIWVADAGEVEKLYGPGSYPVHTVGKTQYHWFVGLPGQGGLKRKFKALWFYVSQGFRLYKERRYDCIVTYSHMMTGVCGAILKMLTGVGLIVEVITVPDRSSWCCGPSLEFPSVSCSGFRIFACTLVCCRRMSRT